MIQNLRALYEEVILDHNRRPRNFRHVPTGSNRHASGHNPLCGDQLTLDLFIEDGVIKDVGFAGAGCAISTAGGRAALSGRPRLADKARRTRRCR